VAQGIETVTLTLDRSVALVLFDFLARTTDEEDGEPLREALSDPSELPALWSLLADLEETLAEPFAADYAKRLAQARKDVRDRYGDAP
jgi:hypothetical protein